MKSSSRYTPSDNGFLINASSEIFNRTLYGSHKNDDKEARFFTFAGDAPQFMGALTDWEKNTFSFYAKCGTLKNGLALTPGQRVEFFYSNDMDISSRWFHTSEDISAEFKNGWMEYELTQMSPWFPDVNVEIEAYPLLPDDGFLVHYKIKTDQRVIFVAGFGGVTDYIGRFEYKDEQKRLFSASDCIKNTVEFGKNSACVYHPDGTSMRIGTSFESVIEPGSAKVLETPYPSTFLASKPENEDDAVVKISAEIEAGTTFDGYIVVLHNSSEETMNKWLTHKDPARYIKQQIYEKHSCISVKTPENPLDLTIAPTVIALDASWHRNSFHHGAFGYHAPFLGWRNWYAPTALGWGDRVETTMSTHLNQIVKNADGKERVWFDGKGAREGDPINDPSQYHNIENSSGFLPFFIGEKAAYYNMQECAFDMMLYYIEWTGNLEFAQKYYDEFCAMLDWEERIFDPDNDGLYQNFLNTWISDGHEYNGAGCAQSSAYNYRANKVMEKIAKKLGKPSDIFAKRAEKIKNAVNEKLWLADCGVIAESLDTIGNCLIHPAPELSTAYLAIDCDIVNEFQAYTMLKYTENHIKSVVTPGLGGRLSYCSNWLPKKYSTYGIFPAENAHLALTYFKLGLKEQGKKIMDGIVDCYFTGRNPGMAAHVQSSRGTADLADLDFTDVSSTYLRLVVEGLFGIRFNTLENLAVIAPNFPDDWENASLTLKDISLHYSRSGMHETYDIYCDRTENKCIKIPMRSCNVETVMLDGKPVSYEIMSGVNNSFIKINTDKAGQFKVQVMYGKGSLPYISYTDKVLGGNEVVFEVADGILTDYSDISECLENISIVGNKLYAKVKNILGYHTLFIRVKKGEYDSWIAADYEILVKEVKKEPLTQKPFEPIDISKFFNCNMTELHQQEYMSPRPDGYSIGVFPNGRYAWEWNHGGHNKLVVDDSTLRQADGVVHTKSGIPFATPSENENIACVSVWDNFPTEMVVPLDGTAQELAIMFISTTNSMQTRVENVRITVTYADGKTEEVKLVYPLSIDDWLVPALQTQNETFYFNDYNHATVQRIRLDSSKELANVKIEAVANEVIMGVMGISISR
ncbi:MAG: hypothetical protein II978_07970 [Clostridia bacterium]|nr:hypothetical protein [Clostridia bacterium]